MNFALVDDAVHFEISEAWLNAPERATLSDWLLHVASAHRTANGTTHIELATELWSTWAALPSRDAAPEEIDLWRRRHELLARIGGRAAQRLEIASVGHVGGRELELTCRIDGTKTSISAPVVPTAAGQTLLLPATFEAARLASAIRPGMEHAAQLAAVGALTRYVARARELLDQADVELEIALDEHLASMKFEVVDEAALAWSTSGRGHTLYDLTLEVREGDGDAYKKLAIANLDPTAPIISVSGKEHLLLSEEIASVARIAKKNRNKLRRHVADALSDPKKVLPSGFAFDGIDLSRYSPRVGGFETVVRADRPVDIRASGIAWYEEDDGAPFLRLEIAQSDGTLATLDFASPVDVQSFVEQAAAAPEGATIQADGKEVAPTPALIARMRETLVLHEERLRANAEAAQQASDSTDVPGATESAPKRRGALAAIIKEVDEAAAPSELSPIDEAAVPWTTIASLLQPGIELKPHQREGVAWLWHHYRHDASGVLLADDMGLGKTLQIATFLALTRASSKDPKRLPSLIVAPVILLENWRRELVKFFKPDVFEALIVLHEGPLRQRVKRPPRTGTRDAP